MTDSDRCLRILARTGTIETGHFLLSSGLHSAQYVQCAKALEHPADAAALGAALAQRLAGENVDWIASPPLGALLIGYEVARSLGRPFLFPERTDHRTFSLRRGFTLRPAERVAVVEDVVTTGRTTGELIALLRSLGADVVALAAIVDRSPGRDIEGLPVVSLLKLSIPTYEPAACPLCAAGAPLVKPGSRGETGNAR